MAYKPEGFNILHLVPNVPIVHIMINKVNVMM